MKRKREEEEKGKKKGPTDKQEAQVSGSRTCLVPVLNGQCPASAVSQWGLTCWYT